MTPDRELPFRNDRVCPRCGIPSGDEVFCVSCGLNLRHQAELPTADAYAARKREESWLAAGEQKRRGTQDRAEEERRATKADQRTKEERSASDEEPLPLAPLHDAVELPSRRRPRRRVLTLIGLVAALAGGAVVAGVAITGGGSNSNTSSQSIETFTQGFKPVNAEIMALGEDVGSAVTSASGKSDREIQRRFGSLSRRTATLRKNLSGLKPPDDLAGDKRDLMDAMGGARDALGEIANAAGAGDPQAARRALTQLVAASQTLRSERRKLARATGAEL